MGTDPLPETEFLKFSAVHEMTPSVIP